MIIKNIVVNLTVQGLHQWKSCDIRQVEYLKHKHRHTFYIEVRKRVTHNDRDIEIIKFKNEILTWLNENNYNSYYECLDFKTKSCEDIAEDILKKFDCSFVSVLEDNENGAVIYNT